jgi:hypothetical protein
MVITSAPWSVASVMEAAIVELGRSSESDAFSTISLH